MASSIQRVQLKGKLKLPDGYNYPVVIDGLLQTTPPLGGMPKPYKISLTGTMEFEKMNYERSISAESGAYWESLNLLTGSGPRLLVRAPNENLYSLWQTSSCDALVLGSSGDNGVLWDVSVQTISPGVEVVANSIAVDSNNICHITYRQVADSYIVYCRWNGTVISDVTTISGLDVGQSACAVDSNNNVHVAWGGKDDSLDWIHYRKYNTSTSAWADTQVVNRGIAPSVAVDKNNAFHMTWETSLDDDNPYQIKYQKYDGISWGPLVAVSTADASGNWCAHPCLALDSSNYPHIVFRERVDLEWNKFHVFYVCQNATSWSGEIRVSTVEATGAAHAYNPSISIDSADTVNVIWCRNQTTPTVDCDIWYRYKAAAATEWSAQMRIIEEGTIRDKVSISPKYPNQMFAVHPRGPNGSYSIPTAGMAFTFDWINSQIPTTWVQYYRAFSLYWRIYKYKYAYNEMST